MPVRRAFGPKYSVAYSSGDADGNEADCSIGEYVYLTLFSFELSNNIQPTIADSYGCRVKIILKKRVDLLSVPTLFFLLQM